MNNEQLFVAIFQTPQIRKTKHLIKIDNKCSRTESKFLGFAVLVKNAFSN